MTYTRYFASGSIALVCGLALNAFGGEAEVHDTGLQLTKAAWFSAGTPIQDLRERSTKTFDLLDENSSGSITLDEIDLPEMQAKVAVMDPEELRQHRQRTNAIHNKFMNWSEEVNEFEVVDTNNDGVWNKDEYEVRQEKVQTHRLELGLQEWDTDGNGGVELHEFNSHLDELEMLDEDGDGTVSREEAFKSENSRVVSDVLMSKLMMDEMVWATFKASPGATAVGTSLELKVRREVEVEKSD